jgi:hypothetical protein
MQLLFSTHNSMAGATLASNASRAFMQSFLREKKVNNMLGITDSKKSDHRRTRWAAQSPGNRRYKHSNQPNINDCASYNHQPTQTCQGILDFDELTNTLPRKSGNLGLEGSLASKRPSRASITGIRIPLRLPPTQMLGLHPFLPLGLDRLTLLALLSAALTLCQQITRLYI